MKVVGIVLIVFGVIGAIGSVYPFIVSNFVVGLVIAFLGYLLLKKSKQKAVSSKASVVNKETAHQSKPQPVPRSKKKSMNVPRNIDNFVKMYEYHNNDIAMVDFANPNYKKFEQFDEIKFIPEPDNKYDEKAIKIIANDEFIGYVYRGQTQDMIHDWIHRNEPIFGAIQLLDKLNNKIEYYIAFYRDPFKVAVRYENISTKLIKTSKKIDEFTNRQDACMSLERGEILDLDYDAETETYIVTDQMGEEAGEINKSVSAKILEKEVEYEVVCLVDEVTENDEGKCSVKVLIYFK